MHDYEGLHNETGFQVSCHGKPLPLHLVYTRSRDWRTEAALRQIALDILIQHLGEAVTAPMLQCKASAVAAWLPHLHYATALTSILWLNGAPYDTTLRLSASGQECPTVRNGNPIRPRYGRWTLQRTQVQLWLDDWMHQTHTEFLRQREPTELHNLRYTEWEYHVKRSLAAEDLDALGLKLAWRYRWYLTGFSVEALTTAWHTH